MRSLSVILALVLLALAGLALAPDTLPAPYADQLRVLLPTALVGVAPTFDELRALLPKAIAGVSLLLLIALIAERPKTLAPVQDPSRTGPASRSRAAGKQGGRRCGQFPCDFSGKGPLGRLPDGRHCWL